jgi:pimeloyl-ACP methyl ester carboxylesterase
MPYADNQGVRIHYEVEGSGPPLVIQHGFTDSIQTWYELGYVDALKPDNRLILVDARGHGASDKPHDPEAYKLECNVADVVSVLTDLDIPRAHFFGYSMGAWIAFAMVQYAFDHVHALVIGGGNPNPAPQGDVGPNAPSVEPGSRGHTWRLGSAPITIAASPASDERCAGAHRLSS